MRRGAWIGLFAGEWASAVRSVGASSTVSGRGSSSASNFTSFSVASGLPYRIWSATVP